MGVAASAELEQAQGQVKRLTVEMQKLSTALKGKESALSAVTREALELRQHKDKTADVQLELSRTAEELRAARREAQQLPSVSAQLRGMRDQAEGESRRVAELQAEVEASKAELEAMVGRLKYGELEQRSVAKKLGRAATQEQQQMAAAQEEAALVAAQIVADANAALGGDAASGAHPVFGELLRDDGHKRLYSASPTTLWAGTSTWHKQRAFRAERAELIAKAKQRSSVAGWPGSICVHRLGAAHVLSSKGKLRPDLARVLVRELFTEINKVEPVTLDQGGAGEEEAAIITQAEPCA
ncbi:hypothetical protein EMIHUDRAFT_201024 [Emiliania huxleyi CCMP1516]|uniref:Uncharacterized protein n=2 Tax=Emiliania huxleyi TaxID=2903 RepID=A0A0D3KM10_EMIH1|nr:hypothetical protein EMIHUDRAFT_201024 [Emiliania huxleyi CCMP1516]EOD36795.1 hypothetical protein EMIHUDRAFT_201024 [Emiliania huxleyi CCMP1516]|eukprot:XP_005789224.1 hypothetical protein EMIHUDRAFT_201024 [Emiliania huxleyi CCMP1516]